MSSSVARWQTLRRQAIHSSPSSALRPLPARLTVTSDWNYAPGLSKHAFSTSSKTLWRSREERQKALHGKDGKSKWERARPVRDTSGPAPRKRERTSPKASLGVFPASTAKLERPYTRRNRNQDSQRGEVNLERKLKETQETRDKIKRSLAAVERLPPLTDEDFSAVYQDLLAYDVEPPASETLQVESGSMAEETPKLQIPSSPLVRDKEFYRMRNGILQTAAHRLEELLTRILPRLPEPIRDRVEAEELNFLDILRKERQEAISKSKSDKEHSHSSTTSIKDPDQGAVFPEETSHPHHVTPAVAEKAPDHTHTQTTGNIHNKLARTRHQGASEDVPKHARERRKVLRGLQLLMPENVKSGQVHSGIATNQEWAALVLSAAGDDNLADIFTTFDLMQRLGLSIGDGLLRMTFQLLSRNPKSAPVLFQYCHEHDIAITGAVHHEIVAGMLPTVKGGKSTVVRAERYLRALEEAGHPAPAETYALVIRALLDLRQNLNTRSSVIPRAWDFYAHTRLIAHPNASTEIFDEMIASCGLHSETAAPERALDLFVEMVELGHKPSYNTYRGLIRACARAKEGTFYFEALRLLRELLDRGLQPERDIFNALLEGARSKGDLARARWIVHNMFTLGAKGAPAMLPDHQTISQMFLTAATFRPQVREPTNTVEPLSNNQDIQSAEHIETTSNDANHGRSESKDQTERVESVIPEIPDDTSGDSTAWNMLAGPVPASRGALLREMSLLFIDIIRAHGRDPSALEWCLARTEKKQIADDMAELNSEEAASDASKGEETETKNDRSQSSLSEDKPSLADQPSLPADTPSRREVSAVEREILSNINLKTTLLDAFMRILSAHMPAATVHNYFLKIYSSLGVRYSHYTWEAVFDKLDGSCGEQARVWRLRKATDLFNQWQRWSRAFHREPFFQRHLEFMTARFISMHARARQLDGGMALVEDFYSRHPPENIVTHAEDYAKSLTLGPGYLGQMSSSLYPETTGTLSAALQQSRRLAPARPLPKASSSRRAYVSPPNISYEAVYPLFARLQEEEDPRAQKVSQIVDEYRGAVSKAKGIIAEAEQEGKQRSMKEAQRRLITEAHPSSEHVSSSILPGVDEDAERQSLPARRTVSRDYDKNV